MSTLRKKNSLKRLSKKKLSKKSKVWKRALENFRKIIWTDLGEIINGSLKKKMVEKMVERKRNEKVILKRRKKNKTKEGRREKKQTRRFGKKKVLETMGHQEKRKEIKSKIRKEEKEKKQLGSLEKFNFGKKEKEVREEEKKIKKEKKREWKALTLKLKTSKTRKKLKETLNKVALKKLGKKTKTLKNKVVESSRKGIISRHIVKSEENPIITPILENSWEAWQTFNPGAVLLKDRIHFLYRSIGNDGISRFGYASSEDGFSIDERLPYPVFQHMSRLPNFCYYSFASGGSFGGAEDPRIIKISGDDRLYVTYTACDGGLRVAIVSIKIDDFLKKNWRWNPPCLISPPDEIHKNWVIFPEKIKGKYAVLHSISPEVSIEYLDDLDFKEGNYIRSSYQRVIQKDRWDSWIRGAGAPPIKTKYGWLLFYHAMSFNDFSKYKVGVMLLDLKDPKKIIARSPEPILEPDRFYENSGFKSGVVYVTGAIVKEDTLLIYYGGADSYVCVAFADLNQFLEKLIKHSKPDLKKKKIFKSKRRNLKK